MAVGNCSTGELFPGRPHWYKSGEHSRGFRCYQAPNNEYQCHKGADQSPEVQYFIFRFSSDSSKRRAGRTAIVS